MDSQNAETGSQSAKIDGKIDGRSVAVDSVVGTAVGSKSVAVGSKSVAVASQSVAVASQSEAAGAQLFDHIDVGDAGHIDAWPEQGISIWPDQSKHAPLLPPLPAGDQRAALGWILEWPVGWLRDTPLRRISLAPLRRISLHPRSSTQPLKEHQGQRPTRPDLQARPAPSSIPRTPQRLTQRQSISRVSVPMPVPSRYPRRGPYLILALLLVVTLTGVSVLVAEQGGFDLIAPFVPLRTIVGDGGSTTPSANPTAIAPPALGSDASAFAARFGARPPTAVGDATAQYNTQIAGQSVALRVQFGMGVDRFEHVVVINASDPTLQGWEAATADAICLTFLPSDSQLRTFAHVAGQTEYIYTSASLAALFSPASFTNDNNDLVAHGTFNRLDQPALGTASGVLACTLALGQHYLQ